MPTSITALKGKRTFSNVPVRYGKAFLANILKTIYISN